MPTSRAQSLGVLNLICAAVGRANFSRCPEGESPRNSIDQVLFGTGAKGLYSGVLNQVSPYTKPAISFFFFYPPEVLDINVRSVTLRGTVNLAESRNYIAS